MPVIRFVREGRDVPCYPGENLREVALREGIELYGLKGRLGNCGGCGQCITCFVEVVEGGPEDALSDRTAVEVQKLRRRPQSWRLACQSLVQKSLLVFTRPQVKLADGDRLREEARARALPEGPTAWPQEREEIAEPDAEAAPEVATEAEAPPPAPGEASAADLSATSDEGRQEGPGGR
jgi:ferredoxin